MKLLNLISKSIDANFIYEYNILDLINENCNYEIC